MAVWMIDVTYEGKLLDRKWFPREYFSLTTFIKSCGNLFDKHGESIEIKFIPYEKNRKRSMDELLDGLKQERLDTEHAKKYWYE